MIGKTGRHSTSHSRQTERAVLAALARLPTHFWSHACTQPPPAEVEHWLRGASPAQLRGLLIDVALHLESHHLDLGDLGLPGSENQVSAPGQSKPRPSGNGSDGS